MFRRRFLVIVSALGVVTLGTRIPADTPTNAPFSKAIQPFLAQHCVGCHGPTKQSGALTFHDKKAESLQIDRVLWESVVQRLTRNEMPPKGKPQPSADDKKAAIAWIKAELAKAPADLPGNPGRVTLRRLNRAEYNNTIRDLFALDFQPAEDFPSDDVGYGFDNIGDVLSLSPLLLEKYLAAAETIVERAFTGELPPLPPKRDIPSRQFRGTATIVHRPDRLASMTGGDVSVSHEFPRDGDYIILYRALGLPIDREPVRLSLKIDGSEQHKSELKPFADGRIPPDREVTLKVNGGSHTVSLAVGNPLKSEDDGARERGMVLGGMEIRGPLVPMEKIMPEAYRRVMIVKPAGDMPRAECAKRIIENLARKAYRRPLLSDESGRLLKLVALAESQGDSFERGIQLAVQAILVSPHFLFKVERDRKLIDKPYAISEHELATRLSYFLWSSCPDDALTKLGDHNGIRKEFEPQVRRMLNDPKSRALADNFAGQWLQVRNLKAVSPDPKQFPQFDESLRQAMMQETTLFFDAMIRDDRNLLDFLDADFTFVNERLAKHYGIDGVTGPAFRRVNLQGTPRAGILTQAGILTVTSNVTRTSPVKRGKFLLESLLNAAPPPPPPEVPELSEDNDALASGSLRKRMEQHRVKPECAVCHEKMDPLGFAFENFDAIGALRAKDGAFDIDASGALPDGRSFRDAAELRQRLRENPDPFRRCLAEKLLTYALGRGVERADRVAIDQICERTKARHDKMSELILAIVSSEPFQMRTPSHLAPNK